VSKGLDRDAIGAKVKVTAGELVQRDEVHAAGSYLSSSDLRLHFGFGKGTQVDGIEIHWPDGQVESVSNVGINHFNLYRGMKRNYEKSYTMELTFGMLPRRSSSSVRIYRKNIIRKSGAVEPHYLTVTNTGLAQTIPPLRCKARR
jgi:hypothetical protein